MNPNQTIFLAGLLTLLVSVPLPAQEPSVPAVASDIGRIAICHIVPWQTINQNVARGQSYYDMSTQPTPGGEIESLRAEMALAASYGADAFSMDVIPELERPPEQAWDYEGSFIAMLKAAEGTSWKVLPNLNRLDDKGVTLAGMSRLLGKYGDDPNWLHVGGQPAFITFWAGRYPPETIHGLRAAMEQQGLHCFLIGDPDCQWDRPATVARLDTYRGCFDMLFTFGELGRAGHQSPLEAFQTLAAGSKEDPGSRGWVAGLSPGYLGGWISGRNEIYSPFRGFDQFLQSCEAAVETKPNWLYLTTWNDRDETALQPSLFQWDSLCRLFRYYIGLWKTGAPSPGPHQLFAAYSREQLIGTTQRIEVLSLPGGKTGEFIVSGELHGNHGEKLATLPPRSLTGNGMERTDWAIDTTGLGSSPIVVPVLSVKEGATEQSYTLPGFRLRSGWIENQVIVKAPLDRMASGAVVLRVDPVDANQIHASFTYDGPEIIRSAELFRNDQRVAAFDPSRPALPRVQILLHGGKASAISLSVADGTILRAARSSEPTPLQWNDGSLSSTISPGVSIAAELAATPTTALHFPGNGTDQTVVSLASLLHAEHAVPVGASGLKVEIPRFDALVDNGPQWDKPGDGRGELTCLLSPGRSADGYYVRLETASGKTLESPWVFPNLPENPAPVPIWEIETPVSLDIRKSSDWLSAPVLPAISLVRVLAHPATLQAEQWTFNDSAAPETDDRGHFPLTLGRGNDYLGIDPKRIPHWIETGGPDGSGCIEFDGAATRAELPVQQEPKGPFHLAVDLLPSGAPQGNQSILAGGYPLPSGGVNEVYLIRRADGKIAGGRQNWVEAVSPDPVPSDHWVHIDLIFTGEKLLLSLDGRQVAETSCTPGFQRFGNSRLYLGGAAHPFRGRMDNFLIEGFASASEPK